jgi:DNA-binding CsgD family transcriptional regulator
MVQDAPDMPQARIDSQRPPPESEPLLERGEELGRIAAALEEARRHRGRFVVVEGPAGIGKTALLKALRASATRAGMRVLRSRGTELERDFSFGVVRQLFEPPLAEAAGTERAELLGGPAGLAAGLLGLPGAPGPDEGPPSGVDPSFAILHGLYWLCANLASARPLCLIVDDAQWADAPSLRYLAFLLTRLEELDVALVVATRPREVGTDAALLATLTSDPSAEVIRLPPLTRAAVTELVEARLAGVPDPAFVEACLRTTRGTPFLVRELLGALAEAGVSPSAEGARQVERIGASTVGRMIRLRLRRLPDTASELAWALAVLEQSDLRQAARLAELGEEQAIGAAELLVAAGIIEPGHPLTFIHPIVRHGLYSELTGIERAQGHRRAARLLAEQPGADELVAEHLLVSEPAADGWVVERLVAASRAAVRNGAPESAAVFLRRALAEPPEPGERSRLLLELGMAEASAGLDGWRDHLLRAVELAPDEVAAAGAARVLARALNRTQHFAEAVSVLERASSSLGPDHSELAIQLEAAAVIAGTNDLVGSGDLALRRKALRTEAARDRASPELLAAAALMSILTNEPANIGADLATRALRASKAAGPAAGGWPWSSTAELFARTTMSLLLADRFAEVGPLLDGAITRARMTGDSGQLALGLANRGWLAFRRGDLLAAETDARTALGAGALPAPPLYRLLNGGVLVMVLVALGDLDEAERVVAPLQPETESGSLTSTVLRLARGRLRIEQGRVTDALEDFLDVGTRLSRANVDCPSYAPWRSDAALAHLALGNREQASPLAEEELELAHAFGTSYAIGRASRVAGVVAGGERGERLLREGVDAFERVGARLGRARALTDLGAMLRRRNRRTEARDILREALDAAHRSGAGLLAVRAETELRATGARPRRVVLSGLESLTASERRIAELAGQGLTNREIAQTLFITTRTVEGHLTSSFRKLRIDSRNDLQAALASAIAG